MSGGSKILNTETGLMNYQHHGCVAWKKNVNRDRFFELLT